MVIKTQKIVLIGAGSVQFGIGTIADILLSPVLKGGTIVLHDINPNTLQMVETIAHNVVNRQKLPFTIIATTSRKEALRDANFCIISIEVGNRFELWEQDWRIPLKHGNRQIYGENGGPGGLFHSLRIIPPILEICHDINEICPNSYIFNFSNPMSQICLAVKRQFPRLKFIGLCHEINSMPSHLSRILKTPFSNLAIKAGGLNHFSVLLEVKYRQKGKDAYPELRKKILPYFRRLQNGRERWLIMGILKQFGYLPITTDSHFGEYIQWADEVADHRGVKEFYQRYKKECLAQGARLKKIMDGTSQEEWWNQSSGERIIPMIEGIITNSGQEELAVNLPNNGLIDNLPADLVVEVPATVDRKGVHGIKLGNIPKGLAGLMCNEATVQDLTVETAITGSRQIALQSLLVDPQVNSLKSAEKILSEILKHQKRYLGYIR